MADKKTGSDKGTVDRGVKTGEVYQFSNNGPPPKQGDIKAEARPTSPPPPEPKK